MSTSSVIKSPAGVVEENIFNKWATIDVVNDPTFHDGAPLRLRIDLIGSIRPFAVKNADNTYTYLTQINTLPNGTWYVNQPWDVVGKTLLGYGWGNGVPAPWTSPAAIKAAFEEAIIKEKMPTIQKNIDEAVAKKMTEAKDDNRTAIEAEANRLSAQMMAKAKEQISKEAYEQAAKELTRMAEENVKVAPKPSGPNITEVTSNDPANPVHMAVKVTPLVNGKRQEDKAIDAEFIPENVAKIIFFLMDFIKASNSDYKNTFWGKIKKWRENRRAMKELNAYVKQLFQHYQLPSTNALTQTK